MSEVLFKSDLSWVVLEEGYNWLVHADQKKFFNSAFAVLNFFYFIDLICPHLLGPSWKWIVNPDKSKVNLTLKEATHPIPRWKLSIISCCSEIMSSPLVTFNLKTFPKHRATQFVNEFAQIWKILRLKTTCKHKFWQIKGKNLIFKFFFLTHNFFFCLKLNSIGKMLFLRFIMMKKLKNCKIWNFRGFLKFEYIYSNFFWFFGGPWIFFLKMGGIN